MKKVFDTINKIHVVETLQIGSLAIFVFYFLHAFIASIIPLIFKDLGWNTAIFSVLMAFFQYMAQGIFYSFTLLGLAELIKKKK